MKHTNQEWLTNTHYLEGIELFNAGKFWHAHEAWETLWLASEEPIRSFIQGLIQTAAALVHWERGNPFGLTLNWEKARQKLSAVASPFGGLDIAPLIQHMDTMQNQDDAPQLHSIKISKEM